MVPSAWSQMFRHASACRSAGGSSNASTTVPNVAHARRQRRIARLQRSPSYGTPLPARDRSQWAALSGSARSDPGSVRRCPRTGLLRVTCCVNQNQDQNRPATHPPTKQERHMIAFIYLGPPYNHTFRQKPVSDLEYSAAPLLAPRV